MKDVTNQAKNRKSPVALLVFFFVMTVISYGISLQFVVLILIWFGVVFVLRKNYVNRLKGKRLQLFWVTVYLYPIIELVIKYMIVFDVISYSWFWLNRVEHFVWVVAVEILLMPAFSRTLKKLSWKESMVFVVSAMVFIGNLNEFMEYILRAYLGFGSRDKFGLYYWDTIYDQVVNLAGAVVGFILIYVRGDMDGE